MNYECVTKYIFTYLEAKTVGRGGYDWSSCHNENGHGIYVLPYSVIHAYSFSLSFKCNWIKLLSIMRQCICIREFRTEKTNASEIECVVAISRVNTKYGKELFQG